jgi:hypothetical protein
MDQGLLKQFRNLVERDKVAFYKKLLVFLFFVIVATIFWFLSALNRDYTTDIQYPVRYTNLPAGKVLVNELPSGLNLIVTGHGYTLLKHRLSRRLSPLIFDVNSFALSSLEDSINQRFYVLSRVANSKISSQLSSSIEILEILPDSIIFVFSEVTEKKLAVKPVLKLEFEKQFMVKGNINSEPDSVLVRGPSSILDTLQYAYTREIEHQKVKDGLNETVSFRELSQVRYSAKEVNVTIPVEQFTEARLRIPIMPVNVPEDFSLKLFPAEITVTYMVALSDYDKIKPQHFMAVADYNQLENQMPAKLRIQVSRVPEQVVFIRHAPDAVDYIIER